MTKITVLVPVEIEVPDATDVSAVKVGGRPFTASSGFMADQASAEPPDTNKLYGDSDEAYAVAVAANEADHSLRYRVITNGESYRVWPINEQAGFTKPPGYRTHKTPTEQPSPAPSVVPGGNVWTQEQSDRDTPPVTGRPAFPDESGGN